MRKVRFLNLAVTLGLVVGLFAAALGTASAVAPLPGYGPGEAGQPSIYFPWVANGDAADESGPWYSTVTIQNTEIFKIRVDVKKADGTVLAGNVLLNPRASKTWTAAALGVPAPGAGVTATAKWDSSVTPDQIASIGYCRVYGNQFMRSNSSSVVTDRMAVTSPGWGDPSGVTRVYTTTGGMNDPVVTTFVEGTDYTASVSGDTVAITWLAGGARPAADATYWVDVMFDCDAPRIAGLEKHATPAIGGNATTNATTVSVDGYTAVSDLDVNLSKGGGADLNAQSRWVVPIVQTNTGWNTLLYVTNVSGSSNVGVTGTFYKAFGQGYAGPSTMSFSGLLAKGETQIFDVTNDWNLPEGTVGSVWVDADASVVAQVYRVKNSTGMALTTVAQPRTDMYLGSVGPFLPMEFNPNIKYAALVMRDYNGWNTGINIANLSSHDNQVTITYYNYAGNVVAVDSVTIPARAMEVVYRPATNNSSVADGQITSAIIAGTDAVAAAVDEVKYMSGKDQGQAMSYGAQYSVMGLFTAPEFVDGRIGYISKLALPLVQKGNAQTGTGDTSGINLFNPNQSVGVTAWVQFLDTTGVPVAPTVGAHDNEVPIKLPMGALSGATVYTMNYSEMPAGFVGSAVVGTVLSSSLGAPDMLGSLTGISNNVNYDVEFDGSAAFNLTPLYTFPYFGP